MIDNFLVSIIIPVFKTEQFVERCLKSVCEQTLENFQIIIVDDCSPDNAIQKAEQVLDLYPNRLVHTKIIRLEKNVGLASARKIAFKYIEGKYVTCLDSDDYLDKNALEQMLHKAEAMEADIVICDYFLVSKKNIKIVKQFTTQETALNDLLMDKLHGSYCNKLYKNDILRSIEILEGVNMCEDFLAISQLIIKSRKIVYLDRAFLYYIQYNNNSMTSNYSEKSCQDIIKVIDFLENYIIKNNDFYKCEREFKWRKLFFKFIILMNLDRKKRSNYIDLYPDCKSLISSMPLYHQIILKAAYKKNNYLIEIIYRIRSLYKKFGLKT